MPRRNLNQTIAAALASGKSKEDIYLELLRHGCLIDAIEESFHSLADDGQTEDSQKRTIRIIVTIGAILVGAGIFSFIAANWQELSRPLKIVIIFTAMFIAYAAGWQAIEKAKLLKTVEALILLGAIIYGAGIFLVAQMFNIRENWPDGFILWMIGASALAFAIDSYYLYALAILVGAGALVGEPIEILSDFAHSYFLLTSTGLLLVATVLTLAAGFIMRRRIPPELKKFF